MWVDESPEIIPTADKWPTLSYNQLLDTKNQLLKRIAMANNNPAYLKPLNEALTQLETLLSKRA